MPVAPVSLFITEELSGKLIPNCLRGILGQGEGGRFHLSPFTFILLIPGWLCTCPCFHLGAADPEGGSRAEQRLFAGSIPALPCSSGWVGGLPQLPKNNLGCARWQLGAEEKGPVCPKSHPGAPRMPKTGQPHRPGVYQPRSHHPKIVPGATAEFSCLENALESIAGFGRFSKHSPNY